MKFRIMFALLLFVSALASMSLSSAQGPDAEPIHFTVFVHEDYLITYIPGNVGISLEGFGFKTIVNEQEGVARYLEDYAAFKPLLLDDIETEICFRLERTGNNQPLPGVCPHGDRTVTETLPDTETDIFWWDDDRQSTRTLLFVKNDQRLQGHCAAGDTECHGEISFGSSECTVISSSDVNLRAGPGTNFSIEATLPASQTSHVDGQIQGTDGLIWWHLASGSWVRADVVNSDGSCETVPVLLYEDDFEAGASQWQESTDEWQMREDEVGNQIYCMIKTSEGFTYSRVTATDWPGSTYEWQNYVVEYDMRITHWENGAVMSNVRYAESPTIALYEYKIDPIGVDLSRGKMVDGVLQWSWLSKAEGQPYDLGEWHHVQIKVVGRRFQASVDGEVILNITDAESDLLQGTFGFGVGLLASPPEGGLDMFCVDNVRVEFVEPLPG